MLKVVNGSPNNIVIVVGVDKSLNEAIDKAYLLIEKIKFEDKYYRKDIGSKAFNKSNWDS